MKNRFKRVSIDGLPKEDGSYLLVLLNGNGEESGPRLCTRYTQEDGKHLWISTNRSEIQEEQISIYKKVMITPERLK
jgi:hypothetical protein